MTDTAITSLQPLIDRLEVLTNALLTNKQTLNINEAAAFAGLAVSYLYKLTSTQEIPHYKPRGKIIYFDKSIDTKKTKKVALKKIINFEF